ncbi:MAG: tRNA (5-methylaminomethyl-2-thiouridine)(34)-methyltransferase MnmD [Proteobacteria bacterium]|nr:tRNA (5-methylaminomethyl-2-thiouridine)(34)-methyltransferase MnmD [Pseudomonadota bacterium]
MIDPGSGDPGSEPSLDWDEDGLPRSRAFGDVYFSKDGGLAESRAVFLDGCGLPEAWAGRPGFVIGELGFGTGLNVAATLDLWRHTRPAGARLNLFSIEAHPLSAEEARRALAHWPELAPTAALLAARWPGRARGFHRVDLPELGAVLDLAVMDVAQALEDWQGRADAWFLDGFAPALNPAMWSDDILARVAARSAPGARAATYTVAGAVRRGLASAGFTVERRPGFGRKRERLEARLGPAVEVASPAARADPMRVAIVGAGIAGACLARAFAAEGAEVTVFDPAGPGGGGSGNPAALVTPRLDAGLGPPAALFAQAFARAAELYEALETAGRQVILHRGVLQLETTERDGGRFAKIAGSDLFEAGTLAVATASETAIALGEPAPAALDMRRALVIAPAPILAAWLTDVRRDRISSLVREGAAWRLADDAGRDLMVADIVCVAAGVGAAGLIPGVRLQPVRGQATWTEARRPNAAAAFGGYVIPTRDGILFGATHDRDDLGAEVREADNDRNLAQLRKTLPTLAGRLAGAPLKARASVRATTRDRLPLAGPSPEGEPGLFVLAGLGSRGFAMAPLLAEHVAAQALGRPSPLPASLARLVTPGRRSEQRADGAV